MGLGVAIILRICDVNYLNIWCILRKDCTGNKFSMLEHYWGVGGGQSLSCLMSFDVKNLFPCIVNRTSL